MSFAPLYLHDRAEDGLFDGGGQNVVNLDQNCLRQFEKFCKFGRSTPNKSNGLAPEEFFYYMYAVFHSPIYRKRYADFLRIDFPRLPLISNLNLFRALAQHGGELVALHLMESKKLDRPMTKFVGRGDNEVVKVRYADDTVIINADQGFAGVPEAVWNFHVGGYQVCEKWLKDRKGRTLSKEDIAHYQKIVVALNETIRLMAEIDQTIAAHGGWPGAFVAKSG